MTESEFQAKVTTLAESLGWDWFHVGRTGKHKPNGAKGTLGKGWPDLTLVRRDRLIFAECKIGAEQLKPEQAAVLGVLGSTNCMTYVWRPEQWNVILEVLA